MQLIFLTIKKGYAWFAGIFGLSPDSPPLGYAPLLRLAILLTGQGKLMNLDRVAAFFSDLGMKRRSHIDLHID